VVAAVVTFLAIVHLAARLGRVDGAPPALPRGRALWLSASASLLMVFGAQESLETLLTHGQLPQLAELLAAGGWTAIPFALAAGGAIALLLRGAARVVRWALARTPPQRSRAARAVLTPRSPVLAAPRSVLARRLAGRGPPVLSEST